MVASTATRSLVKNTLRSASTVVSERSNSHTLDWSSAHSVFAATALRSIYAAAVLDRLVASSPVVRVTLPRYQRARVVPLSVQQVAALSAAMPERNSAMVLTQAGLGLRIGELLALRQQDVDFLRRTVRVEHQIAPGARVRSEPETPRSRRTLPLPGMVAEALAAHLAAHPPGSDGTLFTTRTGQPYRHDYYGSIIFAKAVRDAGLPAGTTSRGGEASRPAPVIRRSGRRSARG